MQTKIFSVTKKDLHLKHNKIMFARGFKEYIFMILFPSRDDFIVLCI